ncbi:carboxylate-amine ligase [Agromyces marinus]|uniref:Putative glutamate--cysteine ligase 2 n=1 Tax=Agromyces marinus TaxID=1389020 RepID=A0ABN6YD30_9MICO|nr:YbdK family carboxylate-amine ligase [Agromyces marinus]UIP59647.1 Putative glutamate--cysteine ligase 2 [Agromyces marinus]BDZ55285.1 putative glutamate--cysteine ligase 2 [Agromyces marinus]
MATFGIEEEFFFLDPQTMLAVGVAADVRRRLADDPRWGEHVHPEFLASQVEFATPVFENMAVAAEQLAAFRREVDADAARHAVCVASVGTPPDAHPFPSITDADRYHRIAREVAGIIADHQMSGLHVHVEVPSREHGVATLNAVRPWLPLLTAMTGNSPLWRGNVTGYESWRTVQMRRWSTSGCPPRFANADDYDRRTRGMLGVGGLGDLALIAWNVRLSEHLPTIEFRMADAQLTVDDTLLVAALCRALVDRAVDEHDRFGADPTAVRGVRSLDEPDPDLPPELLSAATLHAAHEGLSGGAFDPASGRLAPATELVRRLERHLAEPLERTGDRDLVHRLLERLLRDGTGAARQLDAWNRSGIAGLRRLFAATITAQPGIAAPRARINRTDDAGGGRPTYAGGTTGGAG